MRKKAKCFTLTDNGHEILEWASGLLNENNSVTLEVLLDLVYSNFSEEMILQHRSAMEVFDGRRKEFREKSQG